jgi:hypothetical protein
VLQNIPRCCGGIANHNKFSENSDLAPR